MYEHNFRPIEFEYILKGLKGFCLIKGALIQSEYEFLDACQKCFFKNTSDIYELLPVSVEEANVHICESNRRLFIHLIILLVATNLDVHIQSIRFLEQYAHLLGIKEPSIKLLYQALEGKYTDIYNHLKLELFKPLDVPQLLECYVPEKHYNIICKDPKIGRQFKKMGRLPKGTLGREYYNHICSNGFNRYNGRPSNNKFIIVHDLVHVLSNYDTSPQGEIQNFFFTAGTVYSYNQLPLLLYAIFIYQQGLPIILTTENKSEGVTKGAFNAPLAFQALQRGKQANIELTEQWDYWKVMGENVETLQKFYNISVA